MELKEKFNEEKLIELLEDKIREAKEYFTDEEDITEEEIKGYINGLEMAKAIIKEHEYLYEIEVKKNDN